MRLLPKHEDSTSGNNGCTGWYPTEGQPPEGYAGQDNRPGTVWHGVDIGTDRLTKVTDNETGVWTPQNVTDDFVATRLAELGMIDAADEYRRRVDVPA